ncbi:GmrSD restriction endonuclease domain-containing protein [Helicobacter pylori]
MDAKATTLLGFFEENQNNQFVIPIYLYQRLYSWKKEQCEQLWDDIIKIGGNDKMNRHFIGSILYVRDGNTPSSPLLIIDGQQRLTTITLLLIALKNHSSDEVKILEKFSREKIESYLINSDKDGDKKFRLILSESDKDTLLFLIDKNKRKPSEPSVKIVENFKLFEKWISENTDKLETIFKGLEKLMIVWIALDKGKDDPQLIFESMNSKGIELTQTDLIRNYIIMETETEEKQKDFYNGYWRAMEENFKQNETLFNRFVRHYLTIKTGKIPNIKKVYEAFKDYQQKEGIEIEDLLKDLQKYCGYFCQIAFKKEADESDKRLNKALGFLVDLEMDVVYPLLLELYSDYRDGVLSKQDFISIIALTESYLCRRAVCGLGANGLNKIFPSFTKKIDKKQYLKSVEKHFGSLKGKQRFPNNDEFKDLFITIDFYKLQKNKYFLERLENFETNEPVNTQECSIEHIMPQTLTLEWQRDLGENFEAIHEKYLHTIGNLTLTGYNAKYSNKSFQEKKDMEKGFKQSSLELNQSLKDLESFGEKEIEERANDLVDWALKIWTYPILEAETLEKYKPKKEKKEKKEKEEYKLKKEKKVYDLSSYKFSPHSRELFDILRKEIKALDERVTENFMKHYITYKHDTIFASVVPLKSELTLNLKMDFSELQDEIKEKLKIRDVSHIGHLGIVSKKVKVVEVKLETKENIPYCLGLIKQALEKQMGGRNRQ